MTPWNRCPPNRTVAPCLCDLRHHLCLPALADKHRISLAWLGRRAIIEFLERNEQEELQLPLKLPSQRADSGR